MTYDLDRFSRPLEGEKNSPSLEMIEEQREQNKRDIVQTYVSNYMYQFDSLPDAQYIQETLYKIDIDLDIIQDEIRSYAACNEIQNNGPSSTQY
jgi:hypothetical protein